MKAALLTLGFVCAAPARADVAVPPAAGWRDGCVARLDDAARRAALPAGARVSVIPLRQESGAPNPVQYVEYGWAGFAVTVGEEPERRPDASWKRHGGVYFRRLHNRFGKIEGSNWPAPFKTAVDDCLKMGESK